MDKNDCIEIVRDDIDMSYSVMVMGIRLWQTFSNEVDAQLAAEEYLKARGLWEEDNHE